MEPVRKKTILLVEDKFVLYDELSEFFREQGFAVLQQSSDKAVDNYEDAVALIKQSAPDIAVLDIDIKGTKDGIELGSFIKQYYDIPVIFLSAYDNYENLERIRRIDGDAFVLKMSKPFDKRQLWNTIQIELPKLERKKNEKSRGDFFKVKEIDLTKMARPTKEDHYHPIRQKTFLNWDDINFLESYNASTGEGNNNLLIHLQGGKTYITRKTMKEAEEELPSFFARFNQSHIVNVRHITAEGESEAVYFIGDRAFRISDGYKKNALEIIRLELRKKL